ncbi:MAG: DUF4123 domain-containing protein [Lysobacter sp.]
MDIDHRQLAAHAFAIINPLQVDRSQWADLPTTALTPSALAAKADSMPVLLDLTRLDESRRVAVLTRADAWNKDYDAPFFSLLLKTSAAPARVAMHLSGQLLHDAPDGTRTLLRWYDPRVFQHLRWLLTDAQLRRLGGPVEAWAWRDANTRWHTHDVRAGTDIDTRLRLSTEQWAVIGRMGVLNRTIAQLRRNAMEIVLNDDAFRRIDACLRQAYDAHEMTDEADARLFAEQGVCYPGIHAHPEVQRRLARARERSITYVGACVDLDPAALDNRMPERAPQRKEALT